jgi:hypothetical protein
MSFKGSSASVVDCDFKRDIVDCVREETWSCRQFCIVGEADKADIRYASGWR